MLTSKVKKRIDIPHEPGEWLEIRQLSGKALERAASAKAMQLMESFRALGGDVLRFLQDQEQRTSILAQGDAEAAQNPLVRYDIDTVLRCGIVGWSYDAKLTTETIEDLDPVTRDWAAKEILALSDRSEADRKND